MNITSLPITGLIIGEVSPSVVVCGDPARADHIASHLEGCGLLGHKREYRAHRGHYAGTTITVCSHGIGAPGAAIAFEELIAAGARRIIRVGTCGGLQPDIQRGHLILATAAVQNNGYGREVVPEGYPAVADLDLTQRLRHAVADINSVNEFSYQQGFVLSRDAFYGAVATPATPDYQQMSRARVLAVEMECAALFLVGSLRNIATAAILAVDGNVLESRESMDNYAPAGDVVKNAIDIATICALEALKGTDE